MNFRRAVPRQPVEWNGTYRFDGDPEGHWRKCQISDISPEGAGIKLFDTTPAESEDRQIFLLVELHGDVRSAVPLESDDVRVGIEFRGLAGDAAKYVESIRGLSERYRW